MTPTSQAPSLVAESLRLARDLANEARKAECEMYADFLDGDQIGYIDPNPWESGEHFGRRPKLVFPFTDLILSELSLLYKRPPARYFEAKAEKKARAKDARPTIQADAVAEWLEKHAEHGAPVDHALYVADKLTRLYGNMAVRVTPDMDEKFPRWDWFTPDQVDVIQDPMRPYLAQMVILCINRPSTVTSDPSLYQCFTNEETWLIKRGQIADRKPNELGRIPVLFFGNSVEAQRFWSPGFGSRIVPQSRVFDRVWSSLVWLVLTQCHAQAVGKNVAPKFAEDLMNGRAGYGSDRLFLLDKDGEFSYESPNPNVQGMLDTLNRIVETTYWTCGLPKDRYAQQSAPQSGFAAMVQNSHVLEDRQLRATIWGPKERALWNLTFDVAEKWLGGPPRPETITIDYTEPTPPVPLQERLQEIEFEIKSHLVSLVDLYLAKNPDMTPEEALVELKRNADINQQIAGKKKGGIADFLQIEPEVEDEGAGVKDGEDMP
jgi:hypothetical protein